MGFLLVFWWPVAESNHGHADFQSKTLAFYLVGTAKKRNSFSCFLVGRPSRPNQ